jgi:hypothetical protein
MHSRLYVVSLVIAMSASWVPMQGGSMEEHQKDTWAGVVFAGMLLMLLLGGLLVLRLLGH